LTRFLPLFLAIGLIAAGCGGDDSGEKRTAPSVSIPPVTAPVATSTAPATTTSPVKSTTSGKTTTSYNQNLPDSATNDIPPPKGSPQAQFEQQCKQNPAACG
jgi:hypothetical protein